MRTKMNYYDSDLKAEALKLWCYISPNVSRRHNHFFTHILRFLRFLIGTWHKIIVWQIQTTNINNRVSSSKFIMTCWCYQSIALLRKRVFRRIFISLHYFYYHYCILKSFTTILQLMSTIWKYFYYLNCRPNCTDVYQS